MDVGRKFGVVKVGCQVHTITEWRRSCNEIATEHAVNVSQAEVDALMSLIETR